MYTLLDFVDASQTDTKWDSQLKINILLLSSDSKLSKFATDTFIC